MKLSRRDWIALLLGAPIAGNGCRKSRLEPIAGKVVGGDSKLGHRIRHGERVPEGAPVRRVPVVIVGGGIAGLSAAWHLERSGLGDYVVLELESRAGGTSCYGTDGVVPYPWAAHYLPLPSAEHQSLCSLLVEMNLVYRNPDGTITAHEEHLVRDPEERLFVAGEWIDGLIPTPVMNAEDRAEWERFLGIVRRWVAFRDADGKRAFTIPVAHCSRAPEVTRLDQDSAQKWLSDNGFRSPPLRWFLEYGCRDDYGTNLANTSAWALLFYHASRVSGSSGESAPFLTWPEGNGRIVRYLEAVVGRRLERRHLAVDVSPLPHGASVTTYCADTRRYEIIEADEVIVATPRFVAKHLVTPLRAATPKDIDAFTYSPWMVANIHVKSRPASRGAQLAWDNVVYQGKSLGYVVATHQTLEDDGRSVFTYYRPFTEHQPELARYRLAASDHREACESIVQELELAHPGFASSIERIDVWHWGHAMVRPVPGFIWGEARQKASQAIGSIHFAHTDLSGVALLDEAHFHGVRAAGEVLDRLRAARG